MEFEKRKVNKKINMNLLIDCLSDDFIEKNRG